MLIIIDFYCYVKYLFFIASHNCFALNTFLRITHFHELLTPFCLTYFGNNFKLKAFDKKIGNHMDLPIKIIVCVVAGLGAGLGTGFAGMSAAAVIAPMLTAFLGIDAYAAVGIALASDVLASAVSTVTYAKNKNLDIKNGLVMMICVLLFTVVGSYTASLIPHHVMGGFSTVITLLLGLKFLIKPVIATKEKMGETSKTKRIVQSVICGTVVGFICGFVGAGGGMMMLLLLTAVMGYELKTAVGTSVFIMTFTALTGSASHFIIGGFPDWICLAVCALSTLVFAFIASKIANKAKPEILNRIVGAILVVLGVTILLVTYLPRS